MDAGADRGPLESALRKARWRILPLLGFGYLAAYMDRVNISFAAESMNRDLHFTPAVYGLGAGLFLSAMRYWRFLLTDCCCGLAPAVGSHGSC